MGPWPPGSSQSHDGHSHCSGPGLSLTVSDGPSPTVMVMVLRLSGPAKRGPADGRGGQLCDGRGGAWSRRSGRLAHGPARHGGTQLPALSGPVGGSGSKKGHSHRIMMFSGCSAAAGPGPDRASTRENRTRFKFACYSRMSVCCLARTTCKRV